MFPPRLFFLALLAAGCGRSGPPDPPPEVLLARVDTVAITSADFEQALARIGGSRGDNTLEQWRGRLQLLIDRQLLVMEARRRGFHDDPSLLGEVAQWRRSRLLKGLIDREAGTRLAGEEEVRDFFLLSGAGREVQVGRLAVSGRARAEEALDVAREGGTSFEELQARFGNQGPEDAGGQLRWLSPLSVREPLLLSLLHSGPGSAELIPGEEGFTLLVAVAERKATFEERREQTERALTHRRRVEVCRGLVDRLVEKYDAGINLPVAAALHRGSETGPEQVLVRSSLADWTVGEYAEVSASLAPRDRGLLGRDSSPKQRILFAFAIDQLVEEEAAESGLEPVSAATEQMELDRRAIEALWSEQALDHIAVSGAEIREHFARHRDRYPADLAASGGAAAVWDRVARELREERAQPLFSGYVAGLRSRYGSLVEVYEEPFLSFVSRLRRERAPVPF